MKIPYKEIIAGSVISLTQASCNIKHGGFENYSCFVRFGDIYVARRGDTQVTLHNNNNSEDPKLEWRNISLEEAIRVIRGCKESLDKIKD